MLSPTTAEEQRFVSESVTNSSMLQFVRCGCYKKMLWLHFSHHFSQSDITHLHFAKRKPISLNSDWDACSLLEWGLKLCPNTKLHTNTILWVLHIDFHTPNKLFLQLEYKKLIDFNTAKLQLRSIENISNKQKSSKFDLFRAVSSFSTAFWDHRV